MNDEERMKLFKQRIVDSFSWKKDITIPLSKELGISEEEFEDILMKHLDMSSLEALHATFESAKHEEIMEKLHTDLKFFWYVDVLELLTLKEAEDIEVKLAKKVQYGADYQEVLDEGKSLIVKKLKED